MLIPVESCSVPESPDCLCESSNLRGILCHDGGVTRCDLCARFEGDLEAAFFAAQLFGAKVFFEAVPEHAESDPDDDEDDDAPSSVIEFTGPASAKGLWIRSGTDPWVSVNGAGLAWHLLVGLSTEPAEVRHAAARLAHGWDGTTEELLDAVRLLGVS